MYSITYIQPRDPNNLVEPLDSTAILVLNWFFLVYTLLHTLILAPLLVIRRNKRPLKQRSPLLLGLSLVSIVYVFTLSNLRIVLLRGNGYFPCFIFTSMYAYGMPSFFAPIILSAWRILILFVIHDKLRDKIIKTGNTPKKIGTHMKTGSQNWERICRWLAFLISDKFLFAVGFCIFIFHSVFYGILLGVDPKARSVTGCEVPKYAIFVILPQGIYFVVLFVVGIVTYRVRDNFNISKELLFSAIITAIGIFGFLLITGLTQFAGIAFEYQYVNAIIAVEIAAILTSYGIHLIPIIKTFNWKQLRKGNWKGWWEGTIVQKSSVIEDITVLTILQNSDLSKLLEDYCKKEWSSENFLFLKAVNELKQIRDPKEKLEKAESIMSNFVRITGVMTLNLSAGLIKNLEGELEKVKKQETSLTDNFFEETVKEVMQVMSDTVQRFRKLPQFKNAVEKLKEKDKMIQQVGL